MKSLTLKTLMAAALLLSLVSCAREPVLYLHRDCLIDLNLKVTGADIRTLWNYEPGYDFEREWVYGWDAEDERIFGPMGYAEMNEFQLRRYYLGHQAGARHTEVRKDYIEGPSFQGSFSFGYYDLLSWNEIRTVGYGQSIRLKESLDSVVAYTGETRVSVPEYPGTKATKAFNQPESLFSGYMESLAVTDNPNDYSWNEEKMCFEKIISLELQPVTYIYLVQFVLHNNEDRITMIQGDSNLSAMSSGVCLNSCVTLDEAVTVNYYTRFKKGVKIAQTGETVDVIGGKLTTFGMCGMNPTKVSTKAELPDEFNRHFLDVNVTFLNGLDSTMVFDVTDKVKERFRGGVITIDLDVNDIKIPVRPGGSGFDAVVKDPMKEQYEIII
ncbi:MAG: hypothetical protein KBS67_01060 [Bacteroidales bacterium]|nr:hypothetical protein [Candidatus Cryptobacteroides equifaecalis]